MSAVRLRKRGIVDPMEHFAAWRFPIAPFYWEVLGITQEWRITRESRGGERVKKLDQWGQATL